MKKSIKRAIADLQNKDINSRSIVARYKRALVKSKQNKTEWKLSMKQYAKIVVLPCVYCHSVKFETGTGLDRKDNSKGYLLSNVQPCCFVCNVMKGVFPEEFFRCHAARVKKAR